MKVEYTPNLEDVAVFFRYHTRNPAKGKPIFPGWLWLVLGGVLFALTFAVKAVTPGGFTMATVEWILLGMFLLGAVLYFAGNWLLLQLVLRRVRGSRHFFEPRTVEITPEGVTVRTASRAATILWHVVPRIGEGEGRVLIYLTSKEALVVPERAFPDTAAFEEFVDTAREHHEEARRFARTEGPA
jgi:hypothetical protein